MRLSNYAIPDSDGFWARVCVLCYTSRDGYADEIGVMRIRSSYFTRLRKEKTAKSDLEANVVEKRLTKITDSIIKAEREPKSLSKRMSMANLSSRTSRQLVQDLVPWERDDLVDSCPFCSFVLLYSNRLGLPSMYLIESTTVACVDV
jgi:rabenosyn-5